MTHARARPFLPRHPVGIGIAFWLAYTLIAIAVRGVRWDENYEFGQVILGQIPYPEGHPLYQYVRSLYSLQPYSLAALMYVLPEPLWANGIRNLLFLSATAIPVYLWGYQLSRRPLAGFCAATIILLGAHQSFYSSYPIHVWPHMFSNGPVGLGYMLLGAWALASHRHRLAGALIGFAPLVHLGQFPPLLATAVLYIAWNLYHGRRNDMARIGLAALPGVLACLAFAIFIRSFAVEPPATGPYASPADPMVLWHTFMARYATHRAIPYTTGHLVLIAAVAVGAGLLALRMLRLRSATPPARAFLDTPAAWALVYIGTATATVWGIMAVHYVLGPDIPYLLAGWLPYRLMNHVAPLLVPLMLAIAFQRGHETPWWLPWLLAVPLLAPLVSLYDPAIASRYLATREYVLFFLAGAAMGVLAVQMGRLRRPWGVVSGGGALILLVLLALYHQFGAACLAAGLAAGAMPRRHVLPNQIGRGVAVALTGLLLVALLGIEREQRAHLPVPPFAEDVTAYLDDIGASDAMLLVPHHQGGLQMQTNHPVMADMATLFHGIYRPSIAPAVNNVFQDFYGIYLDPEVDAPDRNLAWHEVWPAKPLTEWQRLGKKYDVEFVIAPSFMALPLERLLRGRRSALYRIP